MKVPYIIACCWCWAGYIGAAVESAVPGSQTYTVWADGVSSEKGWNDVDKSPVDKRDDMMCYAASAANLVAWWPDGAYGSRLTSSAPTFTCAGGINMGYKKSAMAPEHLVAAAYATRASAGSGIISCIFLGLPSSLKLRRDRHAQGYFIPPATSAGSEIPGRMSAVLFTTAIGGNLTSLKG